MAAGKQAGANPLITGKAPDTPLNVQLHPLVLLTISDYITRHTLREQQGPVIGAIIGQQSGRNFTLEHAFECKLAQRDGDIVVDSEWFTERLEQYRDVHKAPALDLVAMFTMGPVEGPQLPHLAVLKQVQQLTLSDSIMLLLFHGELVDKLQGGKLPMSLYDSVQEQEGDQQQMRFRELSFEVETGEAEMIGVDFVAKGGGNATAVGSKTTTAVASSSTDGGKPASKKGKGKAADKDGEIDGTTLAASNMLSPEDEELIASLTAKTNAIKMLNQRITLIRSYLTSLPHSYLADASSTAPPPDTTNHSLLRSINAMLSRLPLLASPQPTSSSTSPTTNAAGPSSSAPSTTLQSASEKEKQDVHLTSLLAALTRSVAEAQSLGSKFAIVQKEKAKDRMPFPGGGGGGGGRRAGGGRMMGFDGGEDGSMGEGLGGGF